MMINTGRKPMPSSEKKRDLTPKSARPGFQRRKQSLTVQKQSKPPEFIKAFGNSRLSVPPQATRNNGVHLQTQLQGRQTHLQQNQNRQQSMTVFKTPEATTSRRERFARKQSQPEGSSAQTLLAQGALLDRQQKNANERHRPSSNYRNDQKSKQFGMLTPNSRQTVQQLNQFISELTNRDGFFGAGNNMQRQQTAQANLTRQTIGKDSNNSGQVFGATAATTVRSPSIKKTMNRNFTRNTAVHTMTENEESRVGAFSTRDDETIRQQQMLQSSFRNTKERQEKTQKSYRIKQGLQLNFPSGQKLHEDDKQYQQPVQVNQNGYLQLQHSQMINESSKFENMEGSYNDENEYLDSKRATIPVRSSISQLRGSLANLSGTLNQSVQKQPVATLDTSKLVVQQQPKTPIKPDPPIYKSMLQTIQTTTVPSSAFASSVDINTPGMESIALQKRKQSIVWSTARSIRLVIRLQPSIPKVLSQVKEPVLPLTVIRQHSERQESIKLVDFEAKCDQVLDEYTSQEAVFTQVKDLVKSFTGGKNCTVLAYGSIGSGKTHTMLGSSFYEFLQLDENQMDQTSPKKKSSTQNNKSLNQMPTSGPRTPKQLQKQRTLARQLTKKATLSPKQKDNVIEVGLEQPPTINLQTMRLLQDMSDSEGRGLVPRAIKAIFERIKRKNLSVTFSCSFIQIHHENIIDLLPVEESEGNSLFQSLRIKEIQANNTQSPFTAKRQAQVRVENMAEYWVSSEWDCLNLLRQGERNRLTRMKKLNMRGSRSSSLFQLSMYNAKDGSATRFNFCDLAASDQVSLQEEIDARHLVDLKKIDLSVKTLEKVVKTVYASQATAQHQPLPYRESKLTRILGDNLTQNTLVVTTLSPNVASCDETVATLQFIDDVQSCGQSRNKKENQVDLVKMFKAQPVQPQTSVQTQGQQLNRLNKQSYDNEKKIEQMQKEINDMKLRMTDNKIQSTTTNPAQEAYLLKQAKKEQERLVQENRKLQQQIVGTMQKATLSSAVGQEEQSAATNATVSQQTSKNLNPGSQSKQTGSVAAAIKVDQQNAQQQQPSKQNIIVGQQTIMTSSSSRAKLIQEESRQLQRQSSTISKHGSLKNPAIVQNTMTPDMLIMNYDKAADYLKKGQICHQSVSTLDNAIDNHVGKECGGSEGSHSLLKKLRQQSTGILQDQRSSSKQSLGAHMLQSTDQNNQFGKAVTNGRNSSIQKKSAKQSQRSSTVLTSTKDEKESNKSVLDFAPHVVASMELMRNIEKSQSLTITPQESVKFDVVDRQPKLQSFDQIDIEEICKAGTDKVDEALSLLNKVLFATGKHSNMKGLKVVGWKPTPVKEILEDFHEVEDTPRQPIVKRISPCGSRETLLPMSPYTAMDDNSLGIYLDADSLQHHLDQSSMLFQQSGQKPAVMAAQGKHLGGSFDRMKFIEESADKMFAIDEITGDLLNMTAESSEVRNAGRVSHIGSDGMYAGDRSRSSTPVQQMDLSALIAQQEMKLARQRARFSVFRIPPQPEPQPQRQSQSWMTHGNSIGNGAIIVVAPPDMSQPRRKRPEKEIQSPTSAINNTSALMRRFGGPNQLAPQFASPPKKKVRSILVPSMWSKKNRPTSPIEYDFRGRRVTPKKSVNSMPKKVPTGQRITCMGSSYYVPGKYAKVSVKDLVTDNKKESELKVAQ